MLITFLPINRHIQVEAGANLFQVAREHDIDLGGVCSGNKTCGKCKAIVTKGNTKVFDEEELLQLTEEERDAGIRLTCCFSIVQDTCVMIPGNNINNTQSSHIEVDHIEAVNIVTDIVETDIVETDIVETDIVETDIVENNVIETDTIQTEDTKVSQYGVAFDIGTTSVVAELWNLVTREKLGQVSEQNPQTLYGADVISRITYANSDPIHLEKLSKLIRVCCNKLVSQLAEGSKISTMEIISVVIAANTTMSHLYLGKPVMSLSRLPFQGVSYEGEEWKASDIEMNIKPDGIVYVMPGIGGHVGSDTVGCILAKDLAHATGIQLLLDIGTNGEIVLAKEGKLITCSAAAGPAFEGAALHQGMRAVEGAISKVKITKEEVILEIIGAEKSDIIPIGICGSGVIEALSELYTNDIMDETGRLLGTAGEKNYVTLWEEAERQVILTQKDIRELQLAKGAIYTAMLLLLREEKVTMSELNNFYLAGAFGSNINLSKAINIGLLPDIALERIEYIGNGALDGAVMILLGEKCKQEVEQIARDTRHIELALCEDFLDEYMQAISFPQK